MRFDVSNSLGVNAGHCKCFLDYLCLAVNTGRSKPDLHGSIVVYGGAPEDRMDVVTVFVRVAQALEDDQPNSAAGRRTQRECVECATVSIRRSDTSLLILVAFFEW